MLDRLTSSNRVSEKVQCLVLPSKICLSPIACLFVTDVQEQLMIPPSQSPTFNKRSLRYIYMIIPLPGHHTIFILLPLLYHAFLYYSNLHTYIYPEKHRCLHRPGCAVQNVASSSPVCVCVCARNRWPDKPLRRCGSPHSKDGDLHARLA